MSRASCRAVAKTATAPPLWRAIRRKEAPRAVLDRWSEVAAIRRTPAMRLAPSPLRRFFRGLPREIGADFGQDHLGGAGTDAVHASQVDAGKSPEGGSGRLPPARLEGFLLGRIGVRWNRFLLPFGRLQGLDLLEQLGLIRGDLGVQRVDQPES